MPQAGSSFLKNNAFLVAAVALPVVVAGFFMLASAVPRWTVPPPAYDLILKVQRPYTQRTSTMAVDFVVRNQRVEITLQHSPPDSYIQPWALLRYKHATMAVEEIVLELPAAMAESDPPTTAIVEPLARIRVSSQSVAPDGYEVRTRTRGNRGLVSDLFGMGQYRQSASLENKGRIVELTLPAQLAEPYQLPVVAIGWVLDEEAR